MMATKLNHPGCGSRRRAQDRNVELSSRKYWRSILPKTEGRRHCLNNFVAVYDVDHFLIARRAQGRSHKLECCLLLRGCHVSQSNTIAWVRCYAGWKIGPPDPRVFIKLDIHDLPLMFIQSRKKSLSCSNRFKCRVRSLRRALHAEQ